LAASIGRHGVKQPILVRERLATVFCEKAPEARVPCEGHERYVFDIIAGERRFRASKIAGLSTIPAIVEDLSDDASEEIAITENVARTDLNPMEEGRAYETLRRRGLDDDEIARRVGVGPETVARRIDLLRLAPELQALVESGQMRSGVAWNLSRLPSEDQFRAMREILKNGLDLAQTGALVSRLIAGEDQTSMFSDVDAPTRTKAAQDARQRLETAIGRAVDAVNAAIDPTTLELIPEAIRGDEQLLYQQLELLERSIRKLQSDVRLAVASGYGERLL
jgi:ParB family chromosome partitioning protein